jgi:hypothetical protein
MSELDLTNPEQFQQALAEAAELDIAGDTGEPEIVDDVAVDESALEEAPTESEEADDGIEDVVVTDKGRMIPHSRVKEISLKAQEANNRAIVAETQLRTILDAMNAKEERERAPQQQQQQKLEANPYDKDSQPVEFLEYETHLLRQEIQAERAERQRERQQQSTMTQAQQMLASAGAELNAAEANGIIPDANDRAKYLIDAKAAEISLFARNEEEFTQALDNYKLALIGAAKRQGKSVAELTKHLSDTMGYAPKAKAAPAIPPRTVSAIANNKPKSASVGNGASAQLNGSPKNIDAVMNKNGRGVNAAEFHKMMQNLQR